MRMDRLTATQEAARTSDATIWIVDCLAPFGGTDQMIQDFKEKVFPEREVKWRSVGEAAAGRAD
jgi:hemolysin-activating ACP:hemolysin acyltransferase